MKTKIRVRFAPSPTGPLHIGGIRTALYNYLFAKQNHGKFILRIEDTDQVRLVPGAEDYINRALTWCGLEPDESVEKGGEYGPYRQSERKDIYLDQINYLLQEKKAYYAFDTREDLEKMRQRELDQGNLAPKYDHQVRTSMKNSLTLGWDEAEKRVRQGDRYTVRLYVPPNQTISFSDRIRGVVTFESNALDDKVLLKEDGLPTYHLANVVDDKLMQISHVIRGEEWLSSTAHHVLLYDAFGWSDQMPEFVHLPLILKPSGKGKLSKRDGHKFGFPVFPLAWQGESPEDHFEGFDSAGFDPEALLNFLAFLGWNPGTEQEIFGMSELIQTFALDQIGKSGARFDFEKAKWFNAQYIMRQDPEKIAERSLPFLREKGLNPSLNYLVKVCALMQERIAHYGSLADDASYFFSPVAHYNAKVLKKKWMPDIKGDYRHFVRTMDAVKPFSAQNLKRHLDDFLATSGRSYGQILPLLRIALTGDTMGPDLFQMMETMGQKMTVERLLISPDAFESIDDRPGTTS